MSAQRRMEVVSGVVQTEGGAPAKLTVDADGALKTSGGSGGGGGGAVTQGAGAADGSAPWFITVVDAAGVAVDFALQETLAAIGTILIGTQEVASKDSTLASLRNKFLDAISLGGTISDSIVTTIVGSALLARNENTNQLQRVSLDPNNRALNVRSFPRVVTTLLGSENGTGTSAAWGRRLSVAGFAVSLCRAAATNKSGSDAWLFIKDKSTAIAAGEVSTYAPRLVPAGKSIDVVLVFPDSGTSAGLQLGMSSTAATYTEIAADDAFFECARV